jgi:hypothetical protein
MRPHKEKRAKPDSIKTEFALAQFDRGAGRRIAVFALVIQLRDVDLAVGQMDVEEAVKVGSP